MTLESLQLILGVLEPKTSKEELMENEEEDSEDSGGTNKGEGGEMDEDERGSVISEDGVSEESEKEEQGEDVDPAFRAEVLKALGAAAVDSDAEVYYLCVCTLTSIELSTIYLDRVRAPLMMKP